MKVDALLNAPLSAIVAEMGHTDSLVIADAGLPIPAETTRIDLAITHGIPSFLQVFETVSLSLCIESVLLAEEIKNHNPEIHHAILNKINEYSVKQKHNITVEYVTHSVFKKHVADSKAVVRTGECSPYANIILHSGVFF